jgi:class 3 adenylate cyclase
MNFARVLKEVVWCLVTEGSISYRRIQRGFGLDDEALEDVRRELIGTLRLASDVDGEVLVWAPDGRAARRVTSPLTRLRFPALPDRPAPASPPRLSSDTTVPPAAAPASSPRRLPGAQRRQLTVMFCDLADSTHLSAHLDPEDMGDVIRAYQELVSEAVGRFEGFIAKIHG